jgi:hypothetical protein
MSATNRRTPSDLFPPIERFPATDLRFGAPVRPSAVRAVTFPLIRGFLRTPRRDDPAVGDPFDDLVIDLAGEEAVQAYLARVGADHAGAGD